MSRAVAVPSFTMKFPCAGDTRAPPIATPFIPAPSISAPADHAIPAGTRSRAGYGVWNTQPALGDASGCVRFRCASDCRATARNAAGSPAVTRNTAESTTSPVCCSRLRSYPNAIASAGTSIV